MSMNFTYLALAGLATLAVAATTVSTITLVQSYKHGEKLQALSSDIETISSTNKGQVQGLVAKLEAQNEENKKANKKNNPELVSAKNELSEAQKHLANVKKAMKYVDTLQRICDTIKNCGNANDVVNVDKDVFKGLVGPDAVAGGANQGFANESAIVKRMIADAPSITGKMEMVAIGAGALWEKLCYADAAAAYPHTAANPEKADNLMAGVRMAFQNELDNAEKVVEDANAKVAAIEAALN